MKVSDITESVLVRSELFTDEELRFARVHLGLETAGKKNSTTRKWFNHLGTKKRMELGDSVDKKISEILNKGAGN